MEMEEIQDKIFEYMQQMKGKKKLKEKDIIKKIAEDTGEDKDKVKKALRAMIDVGKLMYSYGGGASSVEIPSEEYLREKGLIK
jgi:predicted transcriptional regulator